MDAELHSMKLQDLVIKVFESLGMVCLHPMQVFKHKLADSRLSCIIKHKGSQSEYTGIIIRDWKRVVGVGQIHKAEELLQTCQPMLNKIIIVSSMGFSYSAQRLAERTEIGLLTRGELISLIMNRLEVL
ncbi:restriction endonuclease [Candidatus Hodarchaeum mangrovi]